MRECRGVGKDLRRILEDSGKGYTCTKGFKRRADTICRQWSHGKMAYEKK